jgi:hypothetical protein
MVLSAGPSNPVRRRLVWFGLAAVLGGTTLIVEPRSNRHHEIAVALLGKVHDIVY